tara:strand:+ start:572 stop:3205 length:2634 start_codon:yes stop_codon:yes gene_type:complete
MYGYVFDGTNFFLALLLQDLHGSCITFSWFFSRGLFLAKQQFPQPFGKYILLEKIALGGMAEIFRAKTIGAEGFEREVAIKRILPHFTEDPAFTRMFIDEATIAAKLHHANIVQIFDFDKIDETYYIAMEFVEGKDLKKIRERLKKSKSKVDIWQTVFIGIEVAKALAYAHDRSHKGKPLNIVHRDVSPQNIMLTYSGEVKLTDFGIAKAAERSTHTKAGTVKGKCAYMSPEQARGKHLDQRSDLFALGVILWEMAAGRRLFAGDTDFETLNNVFKCEVKPPSAYNSSIPDALDNLLLKALSKDPDDRFADCGEFQRELSRLFYSTVENLEEVSLNKLMHRLFASEIEALEEAEIGKTVMLQDLARQHRIATGKPVATEQTTESSPSASGHQEEEEVGETVALPALDGVVDTTQITDEDLKATLQLSDLKDQALAQLNLNRAAASENTVALPEGEDYVDLEPVTSTDAGVVTDSHTGFQPPGKSRKVFLWALAIIGLIAAAVTTVILVKTNSAMTPEPKIPVHCSDGEKHVNETDIDCGGVCDPCLLGKACSVNDDCAEGECNKKLCVGPVDPDALHTVVFTIDPPVDGAEIQVTVEGKEVEVKRGEDNTYEVTDISPVATVSAVVIVDSIKSRETTFPSTEARSEKTLRPPDLNASNVKVLKVTATGATIRINDRDKGKDTGQYAGYEGDKIKVEANYNGHVETEELVLGPENTLDFGPDKVRPVVRVKPSDARVKIDGVLLTGGRVEKPYKVYKGSENKQLGAAIVVEASRNGCDSQTVEFRLSRADTKGRNLDLVGPNCEAPKPKVGYISINANPYAYVYMGNRSIGTTPINRKRMRPGRYTFTLRQCVDCAAVRKTVTIVAGEHKRLLGIQMP